ncbi:hypothetical protein [Massilia sp. 9096]|uniref:hypothetical protein n=1 Tax=Massilia sp. 9096 TaxID=1500894 RepID=UPI0012E06C96|nr:hypothetical protein [Massilia sp. 9096]
MTTIANHTEAPKPEKRRGRPSTGNALSDSQRQARRREKLAAEGKAILPPVVVRQDVQHALEKFIEFKDMTLGDAIDRIVRDRLLRKRSGKRKSARVTAVQAQTKTDQ